MAMLTDPHRPRYHFTAPQGWLNDPNGLGQWGEQFHLFYQHNPYGAYHDRIHWGHAVSDDLVSWRHLPLALAPTPDGPDGDGCWSGCLVDDRGVPTIIYSGARAGQQRACLATSDDGLLTWQKYPGNPVIAAPPPGLDLVQYRDHCVWREGDRWYQLMGAGLRDVGGCVLLYRSPDLRQWEYLHPLCVGDIAQREPVWTGSMWECPDFFALAARHVLVVSVWDNDALFYSVALSGRYEGLRLQPDRIDRLDYGDHFYAPQSFRDSQGRRIMFGWLREGWGDEQQRAQGWSGALSLPRELRCASDGSVRSVPLAELAQLRRDEQRVGARTLAADAYSVLPELHGDALEIVAEFQPDPQGIVGLALRRSPDGSEETRVSYDSVQRLLTIDRTRSSQTDGVATTAHSAPLHLAEGEALRLHIFLDRSVIEVFANERVALASRIYPSRADSDGIAVFAQRRTSRLSALAVWTMGSIWEDG